MIKNYKEKAEVGAAIMLTTNADDVIAYLAITKVIQDVYDLELSCCFYNIFYENGRSSKTVPSEKDLKTPRVGLAVALFKSQLRLKLHKFLNLVENKINNEDHNQVSKSQEEHQKLVQELKQHNQPHELGTVAEIASRFNISKSEVRRRKADGTLNELIDAESKKS